MTKNGAAPVADLSQQEKEKLYQQYLEILEEVTTSNGVDGKEGFFLEVLK